MTPTTIVLLVLAASAFLYALWGFLFKGLFVSDEVRKLEKAKRSLRAQLKYKKEVLKLRHELRLGG